MGSPRAFFEFFFFYPISPLPPCPVSFYFRPRGLDVMGRSRRGAPVFGRSPLGVVVVIATPPPPPPKVIKLKVDRFRPAASLLCVCVCARASGTSLRDAAPIVFGRQRRRRAHAVGAVDRVARSTGRDFKSQGDGGVGVGGLARNR